MTVASKLLKNIQRYIGDIKDMTLGKTLVTNSPLTMQINPLWLHSQNVGQLTPLPLSLHDRNLSNRGAVQRMVARGAVASHWEAEWADPQRGVAADGRMIIEGGIWSDSNEIVPIE